MFIIFTLGRTHSLISKNESQKKLKEEEEKKQHLQIDYKDKIIWSFIIQSVH